jgi:hypothetical protein
LRDGICVHVEPASTPPVNADEAALLDRAARLFALKIS